MAVSLWSKQKRSANQRFEAARRRTEPGPWWLIPIAAGERIVAFARPGKPSGIARFDGQLNAPPTPPDISDCAALATVFKAPAE
jgi:hypothetical protein